MDDGCGSKSVECILDQSEMENNKLSTNLPKLIVYGFFGDKR